MKDTTKNSLSDKYAFLAHLNNKAKELEKEIALEVYENIKENLPNDTTMKQLQSEVLKWIDTNKPFNFPNIERNLRDLFNKDLGDSLVTRIEREK